MEHAVILFGHPDPSSFNGRLAQHYAKGHRAAGGTNERIDLAELHFDPVLRKGYREPQKLEPDLAKVRDAIERANRVVWVFPVWWQSPPAFVRAVVERVFLPGWAFRFESGRSLPKGLLAGRSCRVITTMDTPRWWYTLVTHRALHRSFGSATLAFSGLSPVSFTTVHGAHQLREPAREAWCGRVSGLGAGDAMSARRRG
jgi:putative NADPH-quinone reductase